jgi:predicted  nucleic acid-binding Zn-ribbon protein
MAAERGLRVLESVRCLECGSPYAKPVGGGTANANPGCPACGYLGWLPVSRQPESPQLRSAEDPRRRRSA